MKHRHITIRSIRPEDEPGAEISRSRRSLLAGLVAAPFASFVQAQQAWPQLSSLPAQVIPLPFSRRMIG